MDGEFLAHLQVGVDPNVGIAVEVARVGYEIAEAAKECRLLPKEGLSSKAAQCVEQASDLEVKVRPTAQERTQLKRG